MKSFEFFGRPSGDGESFCWKVNRETLERISPLQEFELKIIEQVREELGETMYTRHDYACANYDYEDEKMVNMSDEYDLYPEDLFRKENIGQRYSKPIRVYIEFDEEFEDEE